MSALALKLEESWWSRAQRGDGEPLFSFPRLCAI